MTTTRVDLFGKAVLRAIQNFVRVGVTGRLEPDDSITLEVSGRENFVYVRMGTNNTGAEILECYNSGVPLKDNIPVLVFRWNRIWRILSIDIDSPGVTKDMYPVAFHKHGRKYGLPQEILDFDGMPKSYGEPDHGLLVKPGRDGLYFGAVSGPEGPQGDPGPQGPQGDPGDAADMAAETLASTADDTIDDADVFGRVSGASWVRTTWAVIKSTLQTYFDTLYVALTGNQSIGGIKTFTSNPAVSNSAPGMRFVSPNQGIGDGTELFFLEVEADDSSAGFTAVVPFRFSYKGKGTWNNPNMPSIAGFSIYRDFSTGLLQYVWGINNHGNMFLGTEDIEQTPNGFQTMQLGATGLIYVPKTVSGTDLNDGIWFVNNAYNDGGWKRRTATDACSAIQLIKDNVIFYYAAGGTIDSAFTWTEVGRFNTTILDIKAPAGSNPITRLHDGDVSHPFSILVPTTEADEVGRVASASNTDGGTVVAGFTDAVAASTALFLQGHLGHASPTAPAIRLDGYKTNGGTGRTSLASSEIVAQLTNGGTVLATLLGSGLWLLNGLTSAGANSLAIKPGTSSNDAAVGGVLFVSTTQTGNVGTGEDELASYSVPANTLAVNGQSLWFEAWGTFANNANAKTLRVRFGTSGTNLVGDASLLTGAAGTWLMQGRIIRTGATSQKGYAEINNSNASPGQIDITTSLNQTLSGAVTLRIMGEATSNNDIVIESFVVGWDDANT